MGLDFWSYAVKAETTIGERELRACWSRSAVVDALLLLLFVCLHDASDVPKVFSSYIDECVFVRACGALCTTLSRTFSFTQPAADQ